MGHPRQRDPVGVGGAAHQEPVVLDGSDLGAAAQPQARDEPDRGVPLPAPRPRADVGAPCRSRRAGRDPGRAVTPLRARAPRGQVVTQVDVEGPDGLEQHRGGGVISTIALSDLVLALDPPRPPPVIEAAQRLRYRDLVVVAVMTDAAGAVPGQLDLPARREHPRRPGAELRRLERRDDAARDDVPRGRVLQLPRRRDLGDARGRGDRAGDEGAGLDRPRSIPGR